MIDVNGDQITIETTITDEDLARHFDELEDDERKRQLAILLKLGLSAKQIADQQQDVNYVKREFDGLKQQFRSKLEETLGEDGYVERLVGEDGKLSREIENILDDFFGRGGKLRELIDPGNEDSPLHRFVRTIKKDIDDLRDTITEKDTEEEVRGQTSLKGTDFEDWLEVALSEQAEGRDDRVRFVGDDKGELGHKKGDFAVDLQEGGRFVVEAKNSRETLPSIENQMEEAVQNRGADYGLYIAAHQDQLPGQVGWFSEYDGYAVVALSDEESRLRKQLVAVYYRWARRRVLEQHGQGADDEVPLDEIRDKLQGLQRELTTFQTIKRRCTEATQTVEAIEEEVESIENEITRKLDSALQLLEL